MNILVATHNYPRFPGDPAGAFVARLAAGLADAGSRVRVVAPHAKNLPVTERHNDVTVERFRYAPPSLERVAYTGHLHRAGTSRPLTTLLLPAFLARFRSAITRAATVAPADVIHAHWWFPGAWAAAGARVPLVVTCHGTDVELLRRSRVLRGLARRVFARAAAITTVSASLQKRLADAIPEAGWRAKVLRMPIDLDRFAAGASVSRVSPPRILYAGNLVPIKGVDVLVQSVAQLRSQGHAATLRILGEGPEREHLEALIAKLGLHEIAEIRPFVAQHDMPREYGEATVTVLPTRGDAEGLGLTLVEALASGCAVVGSTSGGIPEVVQDNVTGLLFRQGDRDHLVEQLALMLSNADLRQRLTQEGTRRVRAEFATAGAVTRYADLLADVRRG